MTHRIYARSVIASDLLDRVGDDEDAEGAVAGGGPRLERPQKDDEVLLFLGCQPGAEH